MVGRHCDEKKGKILHKKIPPELGGIFDGNDYYLTVANKVVPVTAA